MALPMTSLMIPLLKPVSNQRLNPEGEREMDTDEEKKTYYYSVNPAPRALHLPATTPTGSCELVVMTPPHVFYLMAKVECNSYMLLTNNDFVYKSGLLSYSFTRTG